MKTAAMLMSLLVLAPDAIAQSPWDNGPLKVSENGRSLQHANGEPFFWLGDTVWLMSQKLDRDHIATYFADRRAKGFNVVLINLVQNFDDRSFNGSLAVLDDDITKLNVTPGSDPADPAQYDYWDHVDYIVETAAANGIYVAMTPMWRFPQLPTPEQGGRFIEQLTARYGGRPNVIWVNGGSSRGGDHPEFWNAAGAAMKRGAPNHLVTFHTFGRTQSSSWFHDSPWLDVNMFVSGHRRYDQDTEGKAYGEDNWRYVIEDLAKAPPKPTLDGEASFENTPQGLHNPQEPYWNDGDVRRYSYWSVFAGACGHNYGENSVRQVYLPSDARPASGAKGYFLERLDTPGANGMRHLKALMLSRPYFDRVNDQLAVAGDEGEKYERVLVTRGSDFLMAYVHTGREFTLQMGRISGTDVVASWFDPRTGHVARIGTFKNEGTRTFNPPGEHANGNDWVLVLDDASKNFSPPGTSAVE